MEKEVWRPGHQITESGRYLTFAGPIDGNAPVGVKVEVEEINQPSGTRDAY